MEKLKYFIHEGFKNIWNNRILSIASIGVLAICLLLLGSSFLFSLNVRALISQVEDKNQIMVVLKDTLDQKGVSDTELQILATPNVKKAVFVSKAQALEDAKKTLGKQAALLEGFDNDNPYPNAYKVSIIRMDQYSATVKQLGMISGVDSVSDNSLIASKLTSINRVINLVGFWLFIILGAVALFLISNSIKLAVYVRRREINIMKFVGATDGFIRWPFVVEGIIIGIISGAVGIVAQWYVYSRLFVQLFNALSVTPINITNIFLYLGAGYILAGIFVGVLGSLISLRRYLTV